MKAVAMAQTYFAVQTRKQEISEEEYQNLPENERRMYNRKIVKDRNKVLYAVAQSVGVTNYGKFTDYGYKGLYNGETEKDSILDYMGREELGGTMPEDLPTPKKSIKQLEKENENEVKKI